MFHFQILSAVVYLGDGSQINYYNYILTVRMIKQCNLTRGRSQVSVISSQQRNFNSFHVVQASKPAVTGRQVRRRKTDNQLIPETSR